MLWKEDLAYLDDVFVLGKSFKGHLLNIRKALLRLRKYNLKLKPRKCILFQTEVPFLGRLVGRNGISINPGKIEAVKKWPVPRNVQELQSFLGFVNYHRDHIKDFAVVTESLYDLTRKKKNKSPTEWTDGHDKAFEKVKGILVHAPVLAFPRPDDTFILDTDASNSAIGAVLSQVQFGEEKVICYGSFSLTPAQRKYCTTQKELLAVVRFAEQYKHYLLGGHFYVRTDHNSLAWLMRFKNIEGQLARWLEVLSQFNMMILHRAGSKHCNADSLSRISDDTDYCNCYQAGVNPEDLPCKGCKYCARAQQQWSRFEEEVDDVIPLAVHQLVILSCPSFTIRTLAHDSDNVPNDPAPNPNVALNSLDDPHTVPKTLDDSPNEDDDDSIESDDSDTEADEIINDDNTDPKTIDYAAKVWVPAYTPRELREFQDGDPNLSFILEWLEKDPTQYELFLGSPDLHYYWHRKDHLEMQNGVLYY